MFVHVRYFESINLRKACAAIVVININVASIWELMQKSGIRLSESITEFQEHDKLRLYLKVFYCRDFWSLAIGSLTFEFIEANKETAALFNTQGDRFGNTPACTFRS